MAKRDKVKDEPAVAPPDEMEPIAPLDGPDDDADDETEHPSRRRNIAYRGHGEAPREMSLLVGDKPVHLRLWHDTDRQREGFYHRYAATIIADARDKNGKRLYKEFREDKGA